MRVAILLLCFAFAMVAPAPAYPEYCQIEVVNDSHESVTAHVTLDDGTPVVFQMQRYDRPHYVDLFYNGYCHSHAYVTISDGKHVLYSGHTNVHSTIRIVPY
jgi:hypothetical protein